MANRVGSVKCETKRDDNIMLYVMSWEVWRSWLYISCPLLYMSHYVLISFLTKVHYENNYINTDLNEKPTF